MKTRDRADFNAVGNPEDMADWQKNTLRKKTNRGAASVDELNSHVCMDPNCACRQTGSVVASKAKIKTQIKTQIKRRKKNKMYCR